MEQSTEPTNPGKEARKREPRKAVQLTDEVHLQLSKAARRLKTNNQDFAGAAIAYFAEAGLDPRKANASSLGKVESRVGVEAVGVRAHNADIGNRIVAILRSFEQNNGIFLQAIQGDLLTYMERIERNMMNYLVTIEERVLATVLQQLVTIGVEVNMARMFGQMTVLKLDREYTEAKLREEIAHYDGQRERRVVSVSEKVMAASRVTKPTLAIQPAVQKPPKPVPTKATAATGGNTTVAAPAPTTPPVAPTGGR